MEQNKIDMFIASMGDKFPSQKFHYIHSMLEKLDDNKFIVLQSMQYKDPTLILVISILLGALGIDRFLLGQVGLGVAKLLTCGGLGIWYIVDWFLIMNETKEVNFNQFMQTVNEIQRFS